MNFCDAGGAMYWVKIVTPMMASVSFLGPLIGPDGVKWTDIFGQNLIIYESKVTARDYETAVAAT